MDRQETMALIEEVCEKAGRHKKLLMWIIIVFAVVLVLVRIVSFLRYQVFIYPVNQVSQYGITNATEKANLINQYRTTSIQFIATLAQIVGGVALLLGLYFTWGNLITAREGQITERFTRAVDQLGSEKLEIRLGGIYALERIANESDKDYWPIMEILTTYVRENSAAEHGKLKAENNNTQDETLNTAEDLPVSSHIQAILTVIKRRKYSFNDGEPYGLDLQKTYLHKANLIKAHLEEANLTFANLSSAKLTGARLEGAKLQATRFNAADLRGAYLMKIDTGVFTSFKGARLEGAHFEETDLEGALFEHANLKGAYFKGATLERDNLIKANYQGAHFRGAIIDGVIHDEDDL